MAEYLAKYHIFWQELGALIPIQRERDHEHRLYAGNDKLALRQAGIYAGFIRRNGVRNMGKREILDVRLERLLRIEEVPLPAEDKRLRKKAG